MALVLDIQGFKIEKNKFIAKELAAFDGKRISHFVFRPPFPLDYLPPTYHKQATWLMNNHHCISWEDGFTPLHKFRGIVQWLTEDSDVVYVKGKEKATYVKQFATTPVIELEEQPNITTSEPSCFFHTKEKCICALSNVYSLYDNNFMM